LFSVLFVTVWFYAFLFVEVNNRKVLLIHQAISLGHESKTYCTNLIIFAFEMTNSSKCEKYSMFRPLSEMTGRSLMLCRPLSEMTGRSIMPCRPHSEMTGRRLMLNSILQITKFSAQVQIPLALVYVPSHQNISNLSCNFVDRDYLTLRIWNI
jgi:hypothetical protein